MDPPEENDELNSLIEETINDANNASGATNGAPRRPRQPSRPQRASSSSGAAANLRTLGSPRSNNNDGDTDASPPSSSFFSRRVLLLIMIASIVLALVMVAAETEQEFERDAATNTVLARHHFETNNGNKNNNKNGQQQQCMGFHDPSPENLYGANRYYKPKGVGYPSAPRGGLHPLYVLESDFVEEVSALPDLDYDGDYEDDYEASPYADKRLKMTDDEREAERKEWAAKLQRIRDEYGSWNFRDDYPERNKRERPFVDWAGLAESKGGDDDNYNVHNGEISKEGFPKDAWQTDDAYVANFLSEGKKLVERVRTAIYDEYGWDRDGVQGTVHIPDGTDPKAGGVAWMYDASMKALVKKLLKAMMTNDHFFVTLGGHSAAAGHGNNFFQSYMLEFQRVMEPVFDRLGMVLVSANLAQGGMGTIQSALAGVGIYGENDFVVWDSSMTEKDGRAQDLFFRQALLSGTTGKRKRVPIVFDMGGGKGALDRLHGEVGAHVGGVTGANLLPKFRNTEVNFNEAKYNAVCWTDRSDIEWTDVQYDTYGGQASWHPGNYGHQSSARKITLVFLHALEEALALWEEKVAEEGNPLDGKYWHLHEEEAQIREALLNADAAATECGKLLDFIPRLCTTPMRGAGTWSPRRDPYHSNTRALAKQASDDGYVPEMLNAQEQLYKGRDVHIPGQRIPKGEVDVAVIARSVKPKGSVRRRKRSLSFSDKHRQQTYRQPIYHGRHLEGDSKVIPGKGWAVEGHPAGFCDGTLNSVCYRDKNSHCLLSGHNDGRGSMKGDGLSGWLVLDLKDVTERMFLARVETWAPHNSNLRTEGWKTVNNATKDARLRQRRKLKKPPPPLPDTWRFEVAVNGEIQHSWNSTEFTGTQCHVASYNNMICLLWDDKEGALKKEKEDVEFAVRLAGEGGRASVVVISQIYYA